MSDQEIVYEIINEQNPDTIVDEDDNDEKSDKEEIKPSSAEVRAAMDTVLSFSLFIEDDGFQSKCMGLAEQLTKMLDKSKKQ